MGKSVSLCTLILNGGHRSLAIRRRRDPLTNTVRSFRIGQGGANREFAPEKNDNLGERYGDNAYNSGNPQDCRSPR